MFSKCIHTYAWQIGSCDYGSWEAPQSAVYKLETQESRQCNSAWIQRTENKGCWLNPNPKVKEDKMRCPNSSRQEAKGVDSSFLHLFFYSGLQCTGWGPFTLKKAIYFTHNFSLGCTFKFPLKFISTLKLYFIGNNNNICCFYLLGFVFLCG